MLFRSRYSPPQDLLAELQKLDELRDMSGLAWGDDSAWVEPASAINESPPEPVGWPTNDMPPRHSEPWWIVADTDFDAIDARVALGPALKALAHMDPRFHEVVIRRYGLDGREPETLEAVAKRFGLTRERIRQLQKEALASLRSALS